MITIYLIYSNSCFTGDCGPRFVVANQLFSQGINLFQVSLLPLPVSSRVLNELGAWRPQVACLVACVALSLVFTKGIWASAVMILGHPFLGYCYSREEQVVKYVGEMLFLIAPSQLFDGIPSILSGFFFYHNISMKKT